MKKDLKKLVLLLLLNTFVNPLCAMEKLPDNSSSSDSSDDDGIFAEILQRMDITENTTDQDIARNPEIQALLARGRRRRTEMSSSEMEEGAALLRDLFNNSLTRSSEASNDPEEAAMQQVLQQNPRLLELFQNGQLAQNPQVAFDSLFSMLDNPAFDSLIQEELASDPRMAAALPMLRMMQQNPELLGMFQNGQLDDNPQAALLLAGRAILTNPFPVIDMACESSGWNLYYYSVLAYLNLIMSTMTIHSIMGNNGFLGIFIVIWYFVATRFLDPAYQNSRKS